MSTLVAESQFADHSQAGESSTAALPRWSDSRRNLFRASRIAKGGGSFAAALGQAYRLQGRSLREYSLGENDSALDSIVHPVVDYVEHGNTVMLLAVFSVLQSRLQALGQMALKEVPPDFESWIGVLLVTRKLKEQLPAHAAFRESVETFLRECLGTSKTQQLLRNVP
jgi:hypothetical protein